MNMVIAQHTLDIKMFVLLFPHELCMKGCHFQDLQYFPISSFSHGNQPLIFWGEKIPPKGNVIS